MPVKKRATKLSQFAELLDLYPCPAWVEDASGHILARNAHASPRERGHPARESRSGRPGRLSVRARYSRAQNARACSRPTTHARSRFQNRFSRSNFPSSSAFSVLNPKTDCLAVARAASPWVRVTRAASPWVRVTRAASPWVRVTWAASPCFGTRTELCARNHGLAARATQSAIGFRVEIDTKNKNFQKNNHRN